MILTQEIRDYIQRKIDDFLENIDKKMFLEVKDILNKYFGEPNNQIAKPSVEQAWDLIKNHWDRVSIQRLETADSTWARRLWGSLTVYIKFDHIHITNGRRNKGHDIKDLWVRFNISPDGKCSNLSGARSTVTFAEAQAGYLHSHLSPVSFYETRYPPGWGGFCLGSGPINQVMMALSEGYDTINFTFFCLHIKTYLEWESIDGNPYIRYEEVDNSARPIRREISERGPSSLFGSVTSKTVAKLKEKIVAIIPIEQLRPLLEVFIVEDTCTITETTNLSLTLAAIINGFNNIELRSIGASKNDLLAKKNLDGRYIHPEQNATHTDVMQPIHPLFKFKGQDIYTKIEGLEEVTNNVSPNTDQNVYTNPQVLTEFCKSFSADFSEVCFRNKKVIQTNTLKNLFQTTGSNLLALRQGATS